MSRAGWRGTAFRNGTVFDGSGDSFLPEQAPGLASILAAYTSGSARVSGLDAVTGSIREGCDADFAVVNADLAHLPAQEICQATVTQTWMQGQVVYQQH